MKNFFSVAPGAIWAAIIVLLVLVAEWLTTYFGGEPWVPALAGFMAAVLVPVLKILVLPGEPPAARGVDEADAAPRSMFSRWLL